MKLDPPRIFLRLAEGCIRSDYARTSLDIDHVVRARDPENLLWHHPKSPETATQFPDASVARWYGDVMRKKALESQLFLEYLSDIDACPVCVARRLHQRPQWFVR